MNTGSLKNRVKILDSHIDPGGKGQANIIFSLKSKMRGNWRMQPGNEVLNNNIAGNIRQGTLLTRYYPEAKEDLFVQIDNAEIYKVITFNHEDDLTSTIWALSVYKGGNNG